MNKRSFHFLAVAAGLLTAMVFVGLCLTVWTFTIDDAWITFRYARNAAKGQGLVFNAGQRVEGFTSPLWVGLSVVSELAGIGPDQFAKSVSTLVAAVLLSVAALRYFARSWLLALPLFVLAMHPPLVMGTVSGMETGVGAVLIGALWLAAQRETVSFGWMAILGAAALACRPEYLLIVGICGAALWLLRPRDRAILIRVFGAWAMVVVGLIALRWSYYGALVPNTALAKLSVEGTAPSRGAHYLRFWLGEYGWMLALGVPAMVLPGRRRIAAIGWSLIAGQVAFVLLAGGDWMPQYRFMLPVAVILALLGCESVAVLLHINQSNDEAVHAPPRGIVRAACCMLLLTAIGSQLWHFREQRWRVEKYAAGQEAFAEGPLRYLRARVEPGDLVAARDVGLLGYALPCRVLDLVGLTDVHIARTSGNDHRERLDRDYVYGQRPEYILLQSEHRDGTFNLGRLDRVLVRDVRFGEYESCGRWDLPNKHFCELFRRAAGPAETRAALGDSE